MPGFSACVLHHAYAAFAILNDSRASPLQDLAIRSVLPVTVPMQFTSVRSLSVLAQPLEDKRKECLGSVPFPPRIMSTMLQFTIFQLRKMGPEAIPDETPGMGIIVAVDHQDRNGDV